MRDSPEKKTSVAKRAKSMVKAAPEKIVEHAVNTAIKTVEKAADTDMKRTARRANRSEVKLEKAKKAVVAAKKDANRASKLSAVLGQMDVLEKKVKTTPNLRQKIKKMVCLSDTEEVFYYDRRQLVVLTVIYALTACFVYLVSNCLVSVNMYGNAFLMAVLIVTQWLTLLSLAMAMFVAFFPQKLAVINAEGIKIDHNQLLEWKDVRAAEEKYTSYISRRPLIALCLKEGRLEKYRLTFMQHLCKHNVFTPFSVPMYAMRPEDSARIRELIKKYVKYEDKRD